MKYTSQSEIRWEWLHFEQLSTGLFHQCMALRQKVFILEQRCFYLDADDHDLHAFHLFAWQSQEDGSEQIVAYLRAYPTSNMWKIGRVLVSEFERKKNMGKRLMAECHRRLINLGVHQVRLAAQVQVIPFYENLGYKCAGEVYQDAGIEHRDMYLDLYAQPINRKYTTIIFDFDGTLVDSAYDYAVSFQTLAAEWNQTYPQPDPEHIKDLMFTGVRPQLEYALGPLDDRAYQKALERFREICLQTPLRHTQLYGGVRQVLDILHEAGYRLAICTNRPEDLCQQVLTELKLSHYFEVVVGGDRGYERKPNPEMLFAIFDQLNVLPKNTLFVGDSNVDILAARAAKCDVLAALWGYTPKAEFSRLKPTLTAVDAYELLNICTQSIANTLET